MLIELRILQGSMLTQRSSWDSQTLLHRAVAQADVCSLQLGILSLAGKHCTVSGWVQVAVLCALPDQQVPARDSPAALVQEGCSPNDHGW